MSTTNSQLTTDLSRLFSIFAASSGQIRPHFILTGPSGTGKSFTVKNLAERHGFNYLEINAAQLTKEGTSGNSLSKAMASLTNMQHQPTVCFVDEFDKLFIVGNSNSELAHITTLGVQNEFLKVVESDTASVFEDYGKYINILVKNVLFVFAGAFNGEENISLNRLRELGVKTEFLGRVGLIFHTNKIELEELIHAMKTSRQLELYLQLFKETKREDVEEVLIQQLTEAYPNNILGYRLISILINQYFIKGFTPMPTPAKSNFRKVLKLR